VNHRVGIGYDIHKLVNDRKLILGGVEIPYEKGLAGHSDADVVVHAICDALLGALGKGDIGEHFPDNDEKYKDIDSMILLGKVHELVKEEEYSIGNIDTIIHAQEPNLKEHKERMKCTIAEKLGIDSQKVNIKATTNESLGAIGQKQGIAAWSSVYLERQ